MKDVAGMNSSLTKVTLSRHSPGLTGGNHAKKYNKDSQFSDLPNTKQGRSPHDDIYWFGITARRVLGGVHELFYTHVIIPLKRLLIHILEKNPTLVAKNVLQSFYVEY